MIDKIFDVLLGPLTRPSKRATLASLLFDLGAMNRAVSTFQGQLNELHYRIEAQERQIADLVKAVRVLIAREGKRVRR